MIEEADDIIQCPACTYLQAISESYIGKMGGAIWHRCRGCGMVFTTPPEDWKEEKTQ